MYRFLIILSVITFFTNITAFAESRIVRVTPPANRMSPHYHRDYYHNPNYYTRTHAHPPMYNNAYRRYRPQSHFSDINALEKYSMNRNFRRESDLQRLQRLEMQAFGAVQSGDISQRYDNVRNAILARPRYDNTKTSLLRNIGNYFAGQMTGYTPSFSSDPFFSDSAFSSTPYPSTYGNRAVTQTSTPFGSSYSMYNYGTGSSSGVKILD